jgi:hypothetical protein
VKRDWWLWVIRVVCEVAANRTSPDAGVPPRHNGVAFGRQDGVHRCAARWRIVKGADLAAPLPAAQSNVIEPEQSGRTAG